LKELYKKGIINFENAGNRKLYFLTDTGISALNNCRNWFMQAFGDILRK